MSSNDATNKTNEAAIELLQVINVLVAEVQPNRPANSIMLDTSFEKDLGLDSLTRVELISRVEKKFKLTLPDQVIAETQSARDLLRAIQQATMPRADLHAINKHIVDMQAVESTDVKTTPDTSLTLIDVLNWHVASHPDRPHIRMYTDEGDGEVITYRQLKNKAIHVAGELQQLGLQATEPVVLMLPSSAEYFYSFFGVLLAGGVPVPIYPPARLSQLEDHIHRHVRILTNCHAKTFITVPEAKGVAHLLKSQVPNLQHIVTAAELTSSTAIATAPVITANDIAFIQYTSGSTGTPKGVVLTHANLLANIRAMGSVVKAEPKDVFVSWLPLYHDMGLIGAWLGSLYFAMLFVVMPPLSFLARPERWLWAIHHYHGTLSASPNFGYEYCLRRLNDEDLEGLDLSSWRAAFNGAEPVSPETLNNFSQRFKTWGFTDKAMMPVYGLAESTVGLTFPPLNRGPIIDRIERTTFMQTGYANSAQEDDEQALRFVSSGPPLANHEIRIVDQAGHELPERQQGRLEFNGPSATSGYYRDTEKTQSLFDEGWLDTGDLAYIANGELFVTGRVKDIFIRAGRNIYPHELEEAVGNIPGIRTGRVAAFGSEDKHSKTERLIVIAETHSTDKKEHVKLQKEINSLAIDLIGSPPDEVVLAPPGTVLKTSSGKIRRAASREIFEKGEIGKKQPGLYWQITRVTLASILPQLRRMWRYSLSVIYAAYCWSIYCILAMIGWSASMLLPSVSLRWSVLKNCARLLAKATNTKIIVNGLKNIPSDGKPYVMVSNHASYLDAYALLATLPGYVSFIAKKELVKYWFNRIPLKNIRTEFVDRYETDKSIENTQRLAKILKAGNALMFFAEGTFTRIPGLRPFLLGAFSVAAETDTVVIPVAIRGTRSMLRSGSWFPHHGSIYIEIGEAIDPRQIADTSGKDTWHVTIELRDRSREFILRHCGEPDLTQESTQ
ncbi:MAG: AMP-binding protein [Gammaproteobacteria bacterium]|nr:AMP-binding protein [Gammaproteobacteria bacterium]